MKGHLITLLIVVAGVVLAQKVIMPMVSKVGGNS
jgi:hypothetical protein